MKLIRWFFVVLLVVALIVLIAAVLFAVEIIRLLVDPSARM